ncbi:MAG: hypothetical protein AAGF01_14835 [Cyanobacteria bacterium P01_G01_bin.38]
MDFAVCINNQDYTASLDVRKIYQVSTDEKAQRHNLLRVIDESGEDYLYPANYFAAIEIPDVVRQIFAEAS